MQEDRECVVCGEPIIDPEIWGKTGCCCGYCCKKNNNCNKKIYCYDCLSLNKKCIPADEIKKDLPRGKELFDKASDVINNKRQAQYGSPEDSFRKIAELWSFFLKEKGILSNSVISGEDVAFMMIILKLVRECHQNKEDNLVDMVGYLGIYHDMLKHK